MAKLAVREYMHGDSRFFKPKALYGHEPTYIHDNIEKIFQSSQCAMFTICIDEAPIAVIAAFVISPGICELIGIISDRVYECPVFFARTSMKCMDFIQKKFSYHRFQTLIRTDCPELHRWAEFLGMHAESILKKFYDKLDHTMYVRIY